MSMGDIFFWIGFVFGACAVLVALVTAIVGWLIYDRIREAKRNAV